MAMDFFLERVHHVRQPQRVRSQSQPFLVICAGMPRTGTDSLAHALTELGYKGIFHGSLLPASPGDCKALCTAQCLQATKGPVIKTAAFWDEVLGECQAIADLPGASYVAELMEAYPEAKVVLNQREVESWIVSMKGALGFYLNGRHWFELFNTDAFWMRRYIETNHDSWFGSDHSARNMARVYSNHVDRVRAIVPPTRLLEWKVEDGWKPLCEFLDKDIPQTAFPRGNATAQIVPRLEAKTRRLKKSARRKAMVGAALAGLVLGLVLARRWPFESQHR